MVDANVVIAAFLRDSTVHRLLALSVLQLFVPDFLWVEFGDHLPELRRRAGLAERTANEVVKWIQRHLVVLPAEALLLHWERARRAMAAIDPKDVAYVAAALSVPCDGIWSDDPHFKRQALVRVWTTEELVSDLRSDGLRF